MVLTNNDVFENVGIVVWCGGHCGSERKRREKKYITRSKKKESDRRMRGSWAVTLTLTKF